MNSRTTSRYHLARLILAALGILALTASPALGAVPTAALQANPPALLRLDLPSAASLERFAVTGLPVYAQLYTAQGLPYLLLPADPDQQELLTGLGFDFKILDTNQRPASYYLVYARDPGQFSQPGLSVQVLEQDGRQAIIKAAEGQAERLVALGMEIVRLHLHPVQLASDRQPLAPQVIDPDPVIQGMIDQVQATTVYSYDAGLSGEFPVTVGGQPYTIATRYSRTTTPIANATQYTYEHFQSLGLPTSYHYYNLSGSGTRRNVIAEQAGLGQPERIFLVTAHLDSTSESPAISAPGADDNASGSVGVLIVADILSKYDFDCTIRYALFTGEEQGLYGSQAYAQATSSSGDDIEGVLNLDMIAYNTPLSPPTIELHTRPGNAADLAIANLFADVVDAYNLNLTPQVVQDGISASDHYSFWQRGYPAILGIEDFEDFTPYYHTINDQVETLNINYFTNFVKAAVGTMAHLGCLLNPGYLVGQVTDIETSDPLPGTYLIAERPAGRPRFTISNMNRGYQLNLATGTFTMTAQAGGYLPFRTSDINVTSGMTTTLDIPLQPCHPILGQDFTFSPGNPTSGQTVTFTGTVDASASPPILYSWNFGDGYSGSGQVVTHTYPYSNTYAVNMTAANCGGSATATHPVQVLGLPGISVSPPTLDANVPYGQALTQTLNVYNTSEAQLTWTLAEQPETIWMDLSKSAGVVAPQSSQTVVITYTAPLNHGVYTSSLVLESNDLAQLQIHIPVDMQIDCAAPQGVQFYFTPAAPLIGEQVSFAGGVQTGSLPITYTWDFQDGSDPVSLVNTTAIEHTFPIQLAVQSFPVTLATQNTCSLAVAATETVTITPRRVFLPLIAAEPPGSP